MYGIFLLRFPRLKSEGFWDRWDAGFWNRMAWLIGMWGGVICCMWECLVELMSMFLFFLV